MWPYLGEKLRCRTANIGPGTRAFVKNLSVVTVCFAVSKVFSSLATVIVARYLGPFSFGEAQVTLLTAQMLSMVMLFGLHIAVMKYGSAEENPAPVVATVTYLAGFSATFFAVLVWLFRQPLAEMLGLTDYKIMWVIGIALLFSAYSIFTSIYQALGLFKQRGILEMVFAFLLLPGLAAGHLISGGSYETLLIAYATAYFFSLPAMVWRFRHMLVPIRRLVGNTKEILTYGGLTLLGNAGFILTFMIQPLQIKWAHGDAQVGIYRLYCAGSVNMATFAVGIFFVVFFPKVSASENRLAIWRIITRTWFKAAVPLTVLFAIIQVVTLHFSGREYPLLWTQVLLFSIASTLITVQSTYGQILTSLGVTGVRWGVCLSISSGLINIGLSYLLIPRLGVSGAVLALIGNYSILLFLTVSLKFLLRTQDKS